MRLADLWGSNVHDQRPSSRRRTKPFQEAVPWRHAVAPGVIRNSDQSLMRCYAIRGTDLAGLSQVSQGSLMQRLNLAFRRLPGQWSIHLGRQRVRVRRLDPAPVTDPLLRLMDARRRHELLGSLESVYYLTIRRRTPSDLASVTSELFMTRAPLPRQLQDTSVEVQQFREAADHLAKLLSSILSRCDVMTGSDLTTYLHATCSDRMHRVARPRAGAHLNYALCDARFIPGWEPMLGRWHVAFCSVVNFPHDSRASLLYKLDHLPFEHRQMTRWIAWPIVTSRKLFRETENAWVGKQQSPFAHFMATQGYESQVMDSHARNQAEDADAANQEVAGAFVGYGNWTTTVMAFGSTVDEAEANIDVVREVFEDEDFTVMVEQEHTMDAFLSMLPGDVKHSARKYPVSSLNLAHMEPSIKAYWPGHRTDTHLQAGPWFLALTEGSTLFRVVNHVDRVGHFAIIGPTGAGKSTFLSFLAVSWLMHYWHLDARVVCLDIGRSMRALALCLGMPYDDLTDGTVQFHPLAMIDDANIRRVRLAWLLDFMAAHHVERTTVTEGALRESISDLASYPVSDRTFKGLSERLAAHGNIAQRAVAMVTAGDERGYATKLGSKVSLMTQYQQMQACLDMIDQSGLFGQHPAQIGTSRLHVLEIGTLLDDVPLASLMLPYLMHELRSTFTGAPVLLLEDEHALQITLPTMEAEAKRDLRSLRKANVSLGMATHDVVDLFESQMGKLIINSCKSRFLLANGAAQEEEIAETYTRLGCTSADIEAVAHLQPMEEYYLQQNEGRHQRRRRFAIPLQGLWLAMCGSSHLDDHDLMDHLLERYEPGIPFAAAFLEQKARMWDDDELLATAHALRKEAL